MAMQKLIKRTTLPNYWVFTIRLDPSRVYPSYRDYIYEVTIVRRQETPCDLTWDLFSGGTRTRTRKKAVAFHNKMVRAFEDQEAVRNLNELTDLIMAHRGDDPWLKRIAETWAAEDAERAAAS